MRSPRTGRSAWPVPGDRAPVPAGPAPGRAALPRGGRAWSGPGRTRRDDGGVLQDVIDHLACPVCRDGLGLAERTVRCPNGHAFDVARQGYVSLLAGSRGAGTADTPEMVAARERFLAAGHYAPLAARVAGLAAELAGDAPGLVVDAGAGTGYLLARVLDALAPDAAGIALDISKHAIRRAARAHPRIGAVVADVWRPLPVRDGRAALVTNVFAPRNGPEFARVLAPGGALLVVTPGPGHLGGLVDALGLLSVDQEKERRLAASLSRFFTIITEVTEEISLTLDHDAVEAMVRMGPSAHHVDPAALRRRIGDLPDPSVVPGLFRITIWKPNRGI
ncbi:23S rRNA m(1)G-748 methyltransferase [Thermopolyspora flexuosa]|uniref:23S rRNA m(1)G-748 methyltransferase n=1 Tax=Thermopolyspora flexuosa TaxID=103836 RepID=A0A543IQ34_9ACTN|nr:23S rRNA m(1)G-748 methyltransferase [Thermopolyspora flexuosa]